jgi:hypothetical protein
MSFVYPLFLAILTQYQNEQSFNDISTKDSSTIARKERLV